MNVSPNGRKIFTALLTCLLLFEDGSLISQNENDLDQRNGGYRGGFIKNLSVPDKAMNFIVIGDWGRCGEFFQKEVSEQMANASVSGNASFIISTGDNFYPGGVAGTEDPLWKKSYEDIYYQFSLQKPWYVVLGNHDYKINPQAEIDYSKISSRWILPARYYSKKMAMKGDTAKKILFVFMDTNPLITKYYAEEDYGKQVKTQDSLAQLQWLSSVLDDKDTNIIWKFVVGHHPLYTSGKRIKSPETLELRKRLEPVFKKYNVNAYFCGHEHQLEYIKPEGKTHHFISGAGSEAREVKGEQSGSKFRAIAHGFMLFSVTGKEMKMQTINHEGSILYQETIPRK